MASGFDLQEPHDSIREWFQSARGGSSEALGRLLEECRPYLLLVANRELPPELRCKAGASDLVQETFLEAQVDFDRFHDQGEAEFLAWLRRILLNNIANLKRHYRGTEKRQIGRELEITQDSGGQPLPDMALQEPSPSSLAAAREQDVALRKALGELSEEYRQVVIWRNYEELAFEEIGRRLDRSTGAARKLWVRAVERLQELLDAAHET